VAAAEIDAPVPRERPLETRPATKHLRTPLKSLCPSVLTLLVRLISNPATASRLPPLASPSFLHRVTTRPREIIRREDGQLMLAALLRAPSPGGSAVEHGE